MSTLTARAERHYRELRREGIPARQAFLIVRHEDRTRAWEAEHVIGTHYESFANVLDIELDGTSYRVEVHDDETYDLDDPEVYTDEDRERRYRGDWSTYTIHVVCELDGIEGDDWLGGVDAGDFPSTDLDTEQQILDVALEHDMFATAREEALSLNAAPM